MLKKEQVTDILRGGVKRSFTLIELLVITAQHCRHFIHNSCFASAKTFSLFLTLRRPAGYGGQEDKTSPYNTCEASASCTGCALHICRRQMLHTVKPCFIRSTFTLIELLVVIAIIAILSRSKNSFFLLYIPACRCRSCITVIEK